jgi:hypothetical protein
LLDVHKEAFALLGKNGRYAAVEMPMGDFATTLEPAAEVPVKFLRTVF